MRVKAFAGRALSAGVAAVLSLCALQGSGEAQTAPPRPSFAADGTVRVPAFDLPPSMYISPQAMALQQARAAMPTPPVRPNMDIATQRAGLERYMAPQVARMLARYPVDVARESIAGVPVRIVTPKGAAPVPHRVLVDLHGGGFLVCANACAMLESAPVASLGGYKVVSVDYRMAPEAQFPAASEDVAAVYRALLKSYRPSEIGIYGCSAGGALTGQVAAWLPAHGLPEPGAIGIFGSGAGRFGAGDSNFVSAYVDGTLPPPGPDGLLPTGAVRSYYPDKVLNDPAMSPLTSLETLRHFPPTLLITGTRAPDLSAVVYTHSQLLKADVPSQLIVGEGMSHCYIYTGDLPEAQDAYREIVKFFRTYLK